MALSRVQRLRQLFFDMTATYFYCPFAPLCIISYVITVETGWEPLYPWQWQRAAETLFGAGGLTKQRIKRRNYLYASPSITSQ